ncbi:hydantoinase/oxoprolinase N-terminal domain-containing protein [Rhodococcus globerulus]|uniref:Hydantoinase/oxoprolinase N-terminal domain-containing protein n=1 Tax=Rhodococcus globerulus TaxID=33008 RepID=A0ABU4C2E1_RHOGO|nr:hydantoinase/oxoprolinase N-terminal domain-containing protein [Rhodococcus globerulus]MDV6270647.1 hypothetical protein [Rhodococcus globerulus]
MTATSMGISLGTCPAAVLLDANGAMIADAKATDSRASSITEMLRTVLHEHKAHRITAVMVAGLGEVSTSRIPIDAEKVGVLRIAGPTTASVPPMFGWPGQLTRAVGGPATVVAGGHEYDGSERCNLDTGAIVDFAQSCKRLSIKAFAIVGTNSQSMPTHESAAATIVRDIVGAHAIVTLGGAAGGIGLIERENVTILDSAISARSARVSTEMTHILGALGVDAQMHVVGGDGTLMSVADMIRHPLRVRESTRAGVIGGIRHEHDLADALVVHASPTHSYVTAITDGLPWESHRTATMFGVPTSSTGLWKTRIPQELLEAKLPRLVTRMRSWLGDAPVVSLTSSTTPEPLCPGPILTSRLGHVAGALGAATAFAGGTIDRVYQFGDRTYAECVTAARADAVDAAARAGADPAKIEVVRFRDTPLTYVSSTCVRLSATATGPLK